MAYGKIFESLFTGSMYGSGPTVFAVWTYCIANSKPPGVVELNPKLIAGTLGCSVKEVQDALDALQSPDPDSTTPEEDGRRLIREGSFIYRMPTWPKYNAIRREEDRREQTRRATAKWRASKAKAEQVSGGEHGEQCEPTEMEIELDQGASPHIASLRSAHVSGADERAPVKPPKEPDGFADWWSLYPRKVGKKAAQSAWRKLKPSTKLREQIMTVTKMFAESVRQPEFVPNPATWLNQGRWDDDLASSTACQGAPQRGGRAPVSAHIPNTPLGSPSCPCPECVRHRNRKEAS